MSASSLIRSQAPSEANYQLRWWWLRDCTRLPTYFLEHGTGWSSLAHHFTRFCVVKTICHPLERVQIVLQTQEVHPRVLSGDTPKYEGIVDCLRRIVRTEGIRGLWRGNIVGCASLLPLYGLIYFNVLPRLFAFLRLEKSASWMHMLARIGLARVVEVGTMLVLRYAHFRCAAEIPGPDGERDITGARDIISKTFLRSHDTFGFCATTICMPVGDPTDALGVTQLLQASNLYPCTSSNWRPLWRTGIAAAEGVLLAFRHIFDYPIQSVRRRLELQAERDAYEEVPYVGVMDCVAKILQDERVSGFFKGLGADMLLTILMRVVGSVFDQAEGPVLCHFRESLLPCKEDIVRIQVLCGMKPLA